MKNLETYEDYKKYKMRYKNLKQDLLMGGAENQYCTRAVYARKYLDNKKGDLKLKNGKWYCIATDDNNKDDNVNCKYDASKARGSKCRINVDSSLPQSDSSVNKIILKDLEKTMSWIQVNNKPVEDFLKASTQSVHTIERWNDPLNIKIPRKLGDLTSIHTLNLTGNNFIGTIPNSLAKLVNLKHLEIYNNPELTGKIPNWIGNLEHLEVLNLAWNNLEGSIPNSIGGLSNLKVLWLYNNNLKGKLPETMKNLSNLSVLQLYRNKLSGPISSVVELPKLTELDLRDNQFSGKIPNSLGNLTNIEKIDISNNKLSGRIPNIFNNLQKLRQLYLDDNPLTGSIPASLGNLMKKRGVMVETDL